MVITTTLKLYTGTTPNTDGVHVYFTSFANYLTHLSSKLLATISIDNYRINTLAIKVALGSTLTLANYKNVTYAVHDLDNVCYFVKSAVVQSGYVIFNVDIDYWGTYIASATFDTINVLRCNRKVGVGLYDQIRATKAVEEIRYATPNEHYPEGYPLYYDLYDVNIVFALDYNVEQSSTRAITASDVYAISVYDLFNAYKAWCERQNPPITADEYANPIDVAVGIVSGMYGVDATVAFFPSTNDAKVTKAYLISHELIIKAGTVDFTIKSKSLYGEYDITPKYVSRVPKYLTITQTVDPNYNYYVGTPNRGLQLVRTTDTVVDVKYKCTIHQNDVEVVVMQGDNQLDITSEFEVVLTLNAGDVTNLAGIKQVLGMGIKGGMAIGTMGAAGIASLAPDVVNMIGQHHIGTQTGHGDGVNNFKRTGNAALGLGAQYPYGYTRCQSVRDEQTHAQYKGAFFDVYVADINYIFTCALLYGSSIPTYLQAGVTLSNVPERAQAEIKQKLAQGVYMINV